MADYRNMEMDFFFAKFLITGRYLEYMKYILDTETGGPTKINLRFHMNRANYSDFNNITPKECFEKIQELCSKYEKNLTFELRQDFINDFVIPGISNPIPQFTPLPPSPPSEPDLSGNIFVKKKEKKSNQTK